MKYASYEFYRNEYAGSIVPEEKFQHLAVKAAAYLDYYTMGKSKANAEEEAVKMAFCALVDKYFEVDALAAKGASGDASSGKKSESVGSYSVTYQTPNDFKEAEQNLKAELADVCRIYLSGTNLLYRGGCRYVCSSHRDDL